LSWVPRVMNKDKIGDTLVNRGLNGETTYYREISRVLPGYVVRLRNGNLSKSQFWDPENILDVRFKNDSEYVEEFEVRLTDAIKANMRACRPPCAMLTGGLDSSSIAVIAADMLGGAGRKLDTFTAVPEVGFFKAEGPG